ncbi:MAG: Na+:H+ antiporter, NhaA family, partial [Actinomycetota bacterium]|nr:Na+:H+ antiporter, NhaA family [Actinomycetota bacterium]
MPGSLVGDSYCRDLPEPAITTPDHPQPAQGPRAGRGGPGALLPLALRDFLRTETAGGLVLVVAAVVALVWANSPWAAGYERLWHTQIDLAIGTVGFSGDLRHLVNDGLMALFFFVVGLEIKRELVTGELRHWRTAALPAIAALGGMVVPALLYLGEVALATGGTGQRGWGIPMATDIAFAVGVVALLGRRVPKSLELFLLTLAIVDDIGAILVIAVVYSDGISFTPLLAAALLVGAMALLRFRGVRWLPVYVLLGIGVWLACYESGVHATIAGALLGLLAPARPVAPAKSDVSVAERLEHRLHPVTSFVVVPLFALANAGVVLKADALDAPGATGVALGVVLGLVVGTLLGVSLSAWLAVRLG